jgi:hypothetical protein
MALWEWIGFQHIALRSLTRTRNGFHFNMVAVGFAYKAAYLLNLLVQ